MRLSSLARKTEMNDTRQEAYLSGWDPKEAAGFVPWETPYYHFLPERRIRWNKSPTPSQYAPRISHSSTSEKELSAQIYQTALYENIEAGSACSGYFIYSFAGTRNRVKQLSLRMEGKEEDHNLDAVKFSRMSDQLSINSTGSKAPAMIRSRMLSKDSKTQDPSYRDLHIGSLGIGFVFSNFNAASARETWARQYIFTIFAPDRAAALAAKEPYNRMAPDKASWGIE